PLALHDALPICPARHRPGRGRPHRGADGRRCAQRPGHAARPGAGRARRAGRPGVPVRPGRLRRSRSAALPGADGQRAGRVHGLLRPHADPGRGPPRAGESGSRMLNILWLGFFLVAAAAALFQWLVLGDPGVFARLIASLFDMADLSVQLMLLLFGTLTLWMGFLRIAEAAGLVDGLARLLGPLFRRLMPEVPAGHPALGLITLNFAANALGLDNAATPIGLRAMHALQTLNPEPKTASNAQILFLVLNASSLTLLPVTIFMYRAQQGAADPTLVFLPILLATSASTLVGLLSVAF